MLNVFTKTPPHLPRGERGVNSTLKFLRSFFFSLLCALLVGAPVFAAQVAEDPLERAMLDIAKELRCAVCQNQPISESNSDLARDMRDIIREQLQAGKSHDEIVNYFVARYGDYVLLKPPFQRRGLLLWLGPPLLLVIVGVVAWFVIRRRAATLATPVPALSPQDRARISAARHED